MRPLQEYSFEWSQHKCPFKKKKRGYNKEKNVAEQEPLLISLFDTGFITLKH